MTTTHYIIWRISEAGPAVQRRGTKNKITRMPVENENFTGPRLWDSEAEAEAWINSIPRGNYYQTGETLRFPDRYEAEPLGDRDLADYFPRSLFPASAMPTC